MTGNTDWTFRAGPGQFPTFLTNLRVLTICPTGWPEIWLFANHKRFCSNELRELPQTKLFVLEEQSQFGQNWREALIVPGPVSGKSRRLFGPEKPFVKQRPTYSVKLVFPYVVKGIKIKISAKFRASRRLGFEDTKRTMSPEKSRGFRETGPRPATSDWCIWQSPE